ncbi:tyrosine-type recombinase/integrase [bacterium]|nr:tyrosine-type recombinase/integrase [bacterium]
MPAKKKLNPSYRSHHSGQARVTFDGRDYYLGEYDSPESWARYYARLNEYHQNGLTMPEETPERPSALAPIQVKDITADYRARELTRYEHNSGSHSRQNTVLSLLEKLYGTLPASEFGPLRLYSVREKLAETGNTRRYINDQHRDAIKIFEHGVSFELVDASVLTSLKTLKLLRSGEARESEPRQPVPLDDVRATLPHLHDGVADMVRLQLGTACRPSELFRMTPAQVDRGESDWIYIPAEHKTTRYGKRREVPIVGDARIILGKYLGGGPDELCFRNQKGTPWNKDNYLRNIARVNLKHGLKHWTPYQLRHTAAQKVRDILGPIATGALLNHSRLSTTEIYAKANTQQAIDAARELPTL